MNTARSPTTILVATDLSGRCDRALDRSLILARQWGAKLVALTVVEPGAFHTSAMEAEGEIGTRALSSALMLAQRQLRADLAVDDLPLTCRVAQGAVTEAILSACDAEAAGLVITGVARHETLSRIVLGSNVDALTRRSPVPLLVVRSRARLPYRDIVVSSDFSPSSRHALETAAALFPDAVFTLFHTFSNPYPALAGVDPAQIRSDGERMAEAEAERFLQSCNLPQQLRDRMRFSLVYGDAAVMLHKRSATHPDDLIVIGTERRRGLMGMLIGSVAQRILEQAVNDVLLVPPARPAR